MQGVTRRTLSNQPSSALERTAESRPPSRPDLPVSPSRTVDRPDELPDLPVDLAGLAPRPTQAAPQPPLTQDRTRLPAATGGVGKPLPLPVRRYEAQRPEAVARPVDLQRREEQPLTAGPPEALDSPATKVDNPEPVALTEPSGETPDLKKIKTSRTLTEVVLRSQKAIGTYASPPDEVIVTNTSLEEAESPEPSPPYRLVIDPNRNRAEILDAVGKVLEDFAVGTGDTTGTRYGKKYFSPVGTWRIINEVPYSQMEGSYGPLWMGLTAKSYGLHGPHAAADLAAGGEEFANLGFVSHGCIRFREMDILKVGEYLDIGSTVEILPYHTRPEHRGPLRVREANELAQDLGDAPVFVGKGLGRRLSDYQ